jgi:hypothetical protein
LASFEVADGLDGIQATRRVLAEPDGPRVLVPTTFNRNHSVYDALIAGAARRPDLAGRVLVLVGQGMPNAQIAATLTVGRQP